MTRPRGMIAPRRADRAATPVATRPKAAGAQAATSRWRSRSALAARGRRARRDARSSPCRSAPGPEYVPPARWPLAGRGGVRRAARRASTPACARHLELFADRQVVIIPGGIGVSGGRTELYGFVTDALWPAPRLDAAAGRRDPARARPGCSSASSSRSGASRSATTAARLHRRGPRLRQRRRAPRRPRGDRAARPRPGRASRSAATFRRTVVSRSPRPGLRGRHDPAHQLRPARGHDARRCARRWSAARARARRGPRAPPCARTCPRRSGSSRTAWNDLFRNGILDHDLKELCRVYVSRSVKCEYCGNQRSVQGASLGLHEGQYDELLELRGLAELQRAPEGRAGLRRGDRLAQRHRRRVLGAHARALLRARAGRARLHDRPDARPAELAAACSTSTTTRSSPAATPRWRRATRPREQVAARKAADDYWAKV